MAERRQQDKQDSSVPDIGDLTVQETKPVPSGDSPAKVEACSASLSEEDNQLQEDLWKNLRSKLGIAKGPDGKWRNSDGDEVRVLFPKMPEQPKEPVTYTLPPGDYVIGDILLAKADITPTWSCESGEGWHEGLPYVIGVTRGDGIFRGSNRRKYGIDSGHLGIMDARLVGDPDSETFQSRHQFASDVSVKIWRGSFKISSGDMSLKIRTSRSLKYSWLS